MSPKVLLVESRKTLDATEPLDFRACVEESLKSIAQRAALRSVTIQRRFPEERSW